MYFVLLCVLYLTVLTVLQMAEKTTSFSDKQLCEQEITEKKSGQEEYGQSDGVKTDKVQTECVDSESKPAAENAQPGVENAPDGSCVEHCQRAEPDCLNTAEHVDETSSKFSECNDHCTTDEVLPSYEENVEQETADSDVANSAGHGDERNNCISESDDVEKLKSPQTDHVAEDQSEEWGTYEDDAAAYYESDAYWADYYEAKEKYEFFWQSENIYSQWHHSDFMVDGRKFSCAEQYMMYGKAVLFKDFYTARKILQSKKPRDMKALGRKVQNFDPDIWTRYCFYIVKEANEAKFSQNEDLRTAILDTYPKVLVEASPRDRIWGIGLTEDDPDAWNTRTWQGTNFLGYVLTDVRDELRFKAGLISEEQKSRHIERLLREAKMSEETIKNINPEGWKPLPEEEQELKKSNRDGNMEHKGNGDNGAYGKRAEKHITQRDDHFEHGAKTRRTDGDYHDNQGYRPSSDQNMSGHKNRGQNHQGGSRAEGGYGGDHNMDQQRGQRSHGQRNRGHHSSETEGHEDRSYQNQGGSRPEAGYGHGHDRDYHRGQRPHGQGNRADTVDNWRGHDNTQNSWRGRGRGGGNARRDYERHPSHGEHEDNSERDQYQYFWGQDDFYSQWYQTDFTERDKNFSCAEQYMMYMKAVLFQDQETASAILRTNDPNRMKKLGREVKGFNDETWQLHSLKFVKEGNLAKFSANPKLQRVLFKTHPKILVEASPYDRIWGIGLEENDERAWRKDTWRGSNFLGYILTEVRDELMVQQGLIKDAERKIYLPDLQKQYALTLKNNRGPRDSKTGWEQYDKKEWRAQPVQNSNGPPTSVTYAEHPEKQQSPSSVQQHDNFMGNKNDDKPDARAAKPSIPGLTFALDANAKQSYIPGLPVDDGQGKKKKKNNKGKKNKEESSKTLNDLLENSDPDNFQIPDAMVSGDQTGEGVSKGDGEWKQVKGKNKGGHGKHENPKAQEHQEAQRKKEYLCEDDNRLFTNESKTTEFCEEDSSSDENIESDFQVPGSITAVAVSSTGDPNHAGRHVQRSCTETEDLEVSDQQPSSVSVAVMTDTSAENESGEAVLEHRRTELEIRRLELENRRLELENTRVELEVEKLRLEIQLMRQGKD